ncbi:MAG TPA: LysR substrate-binding domain-containing protein [Polyangia bacterium]|jgi:DNA-binding transcriptional LysR family regulator|nr:LysR substrate-binding domain-containing protein [Polyangia bacterium]
MAIQSLPDLEALGLFVAVVEAGGFSAAARRIGTRKTLMSRRVRQLEERLGVQLLFRTTRTLQLTDEGRAYFAHATRALTAAREAEATLESTRREPSGLLRVTTTPILAERMLEPVVVAYLERYPQVTLELDVRSQPIDLVREGFDVAVRAGPLPDSSLTARLLGHARAGYFASPEYLRRHGRPTEPSELAEHACIAIGTEAIVEWPFIQQGRLLKTIIHPRLLTTSYDLALRATVSGLGITRMPGFYVREHTAARRLVAVLDEWTPPSFPVHVLMPAGTPSPKARTFIDLVIEHFERIPLHQAAAEAPKAARGRSARIKTS